MKPHRKSSAIMSTGMVLWEDIPRELARLSQSHSACICANVAGRVRASVTIFYITQRTNISLLSRRHGLSPNGFWIEKGTKQSWTKGKYQIPSPRIDALILFAIIGRTSWASINLSGSVAFADDGTALDILRHIGGGKSVFTIVRNLGMQTQLQYSIEVEVGPCQCPLCGQWISHTLRQSDKSIAGYARKWQCRSVKEE